MASLSHTLCKRSCCVAQARVSLSAVLTSISSSLPTQKFATSPDLQIKSNNYVSYIIENSTSCKCVFNHKYVHISINQPRLLVSGVDPRKKFPLHPVIYWFPETQKPPGSATGCTYFLQFSNWHISSSMNCSNSSLRWGKFASSMSYRYKICQFNVFIFTFSLCK